MTVGDLIRLLEQFPPDLPAFYVTDAAGRIAAAPQDAVMNLVDPTNGEIMADDGTSHGDEESFVDSVVIYPLVVRDDA
jgi:hypothetical protein